MHYSTGWQKFVELSEAAIATGNFDELLDVLLTIEEKEQLATRVLLIQELMVGEKSQREIAEHLNISIAKITRGSNELKRSSTAIVDFLQANLANKH